MTNRNMTPDEAAEIRRLETAAWDAEIPPEFTQILTDAILKIHRLKSERDCYRGALERIAFERPVTTPEKWLKWVLAYAAEQLINPF